MTEGDRPAVVRCLHYAWGVCTLLKSACIHVGDWRECPLLVVGEEAGKRMMRGVP